MITHTIEFIESKDHIDIWKVTLFYKGKEAVLPFKVEKGFKMTDCSTEGIVHFYFDRAALAKPYNTLEQFHDEYVPHFVLPKAEEFFNAIKTIEHALTSLLAEDYVTVENRVRAAVDEKNCTNKKAYQLR